MTATAQNQSCSICNDQKFVFLFNGNFMLYDIGGRRIDCPHCFRTPQEEANKMLEEMEAKAKAQLEEAQRIEDAKPKKTTKAKAAKKESLENGGVFAPIKG